LIVTLFLLPVHNASGITMFYGGFFGSHGEWTKLIDTNAVIFWSQGDFQHRPWEVEDIHQLADHGVKINYRVYWWHAFHNGEIAWNTSVVDFYYNATLMKLLEEHIDWQLSQLNTDKIWAVTLSEEEPAGAFFHFSGGKLQKYNDTYHSETGFWLREEDLYGEPVLSQWLSEKFVSVYNHLYDYIKSKWPHLLVFQFVHTPWPGATPVWVGGLDVSDLKGDAYMSDLYYYDIYDNPFWLYEFIRQAKCTYPEEYHIHLWGEEPWPEGGATGGFEHIRRNAWAAYLAGVDAIGWFNWHYVYGHPWEREDTLGKRLLEYTNRLNKELAKLPPMKPRTQVLVIRDQMMSYQVGLCCDLGLFNEWDIVNQRTFAKEQIDLSRYKLIVVNEDRYYNEVVDKLNEYVKSGGNLIMLGGFGWDQTNIYDNAPRTSKFLIEEGVRQEHVWGNVSINILEPNPIGLNLQYSLLGTSMLAIAENTLTENHQPIGEFHLTDENGKPIQIEYRPLVLYHNSSNPDEGSVLYWGLVSGAPASGIPDIQYGDVVEAFLPEWNYTRFLYRNVTRAFAGNYLRLNGSLAASGTENMIITQSEIDEGVVLAGVSNYYPHTVQVNYTLDLHNFDLPAGEYWVHSLDENLTLGWFESQQSLLEIPLGIVADGTRLLLISQRQLEPSYSVNIFPDIPTPEEVEDLWSEGIPLASFTHSPTEPSPRDSITFADTSTDLDGAIVSWFWDFADRGWSVEQDSTHQFTEEGEYTVSLAITDNDGCTNTSRQTITVRNLPPTASITYSPSSPTAGQEVSFADASSHPQGHAITSWSWDFGDGYASTEQDAVHRYENPGSYAVTLAVKDDEGFEDTYSTTIDVKPDYTIYYVIGGLLVAALLAILIFKMSRRRK
ncbi:MAG: PKD domain-containing protein, partial [Candidatus Bathyarchaeota archaeon]|nr:PKD domain-containing protein [Candidatus Bathyarchaeota archaeon]